MVNKIPLSLKPLTIIQNNENQWRDVSSKIRTCFDFVDSNEQSSSSGTKMIAFRQCEGLHAITFLHLFFHQVVSDTQPDKTLEAYPDFFYEFISKIPYDQEARKLTPQEIESFYTQLSQLSSHSIPDPFLEMLKSIFQDNTYYSHHIHSLINVKGIKAKIHLTPAEIFSNFIQTFEHIKIVLPYIENRYVRAFPAQVFSGKSDFDGYRQQWREGLLHLSKMKKFIIKIHSLISKVRSEEPLATLSRELTEEVVTLGQLYLDNKETGIFKLYPQNDIDKYRRLSNVLKLNQLASVTYSAEEMEALSAYMQEMNRTFKLIYILISFPLCELISSQLAFAVMKPAQYKKVISLEPERHFYFPPNPLNMRSLERVVPAPVSPTKKIKLTPSSSSSSQAVDTLFQQVRKMLPPLSGATSNEPLMNCVIYIDDLGGAEKLPESTLKCVIIWHSLFRLMEQSLRMNLYQRTLQDIRVHDLVKLAENTSVDPNLIDKLSGTHRWLDYTFEALRQRMRKGSTIPKILSEMSRIPSQMPRLDPPLVDEVLTNVKGLLPQSTSFDIGTTSKNLTLELNFTPLQMLSLNDISSRFLPGSDEAIKLQEVRKDLHLLNELELLIKQPLPTAQFPTVIRMMAKLHHSILEHLLLTNYFIDHADGKREHHLDKMTSGVSTLSPQLKQSIATLFYDLHHISSYPFDNSKQRSEWQQAIIQSEVIRAMPHLVGKSEETVVLGGVTVDLKNLSTDPIVSVVKKSRALLSDSVPRLLEEIALKLT